MNDPRENRSGATEVRATGQAMRWLWARLMRGQIRYPATAIALFLLFWHLVVVFFQLRPTFLPSPITAFSKVFRSYPTFAAHGLVTISEIIGGFGLSVVIGVATAFLMAWSRVMEKAISPILVFLQTIPYISVAPLLIIWFGFSLTPKVIVSFLMAYFPIVVATLTGMNAVETDMIELVRSMSASKWQIFWKSRFPNSLPYFFSGAKVAIAFATSGAIVGEYVGSDQGLGYLIVVANSDANSELLFGTVIVVSAIGVSFFWLIRYLEKICIPWHVTFRHEAERRAIS